LPFSFRLAEYGTTHLFAFTQNDLCARPASLNCSLVRRNTFVNQEIKKSFSSRHEFFGARYNSTMSILTGMHLKVPETVRNGFRRYNVEPIVFFYMIGYNLSLVCYLKLIQDKVCITEFKLSHDFCANIHESQNAKTKDALDVLARATYLNLVATVVISLPTFISVLFVGPW
jgi:hypothetical protein